MAWVSHMKRLPISVKGHVMRGFYFQYRLLPVHLVRKYYLVRSSDSAVLFCITPIILEKISLQRNFQGWRNMHVCLRKSIQICDSELSLLVASEYVHKEQHKKLAVNNQEHRGAHEVQSYEIYKETEYHIKGLSANSSGHWYLMR